MCILRVPPLWGAHFNVFLRRTSYSKPWVHILCRNLHRILSLECNLRSILRLGVRFVSQFVSYSKPWGFALCRNMHPILSLGDSFCVAIDVVFSPLGVKHRKIHGILRLRSIVKYMVS